MTKMRPVGRFFVINLQTHTMDKEKNILTHFQFAIEARKFAIEALFFKSKIIKC
jgi:hypothetical protein